MQTNEENTADTAPILSVQIANDTQTQVSGLSSTGIASPNTNSDRINIGQHPTPESVNFEVNESAYDDGYDSEGQIGPFFDAVYGEEGDSFFEECIGVVESPDNNSETGTVDCTDDGPEISQNNAAKEENVNEENTERKFAMADADISRLFKRDLVEQCKLLGLDIKGNKPVLVERLKKAREDGHCYLPPELLGNADIVQLTNDGFSPNSRWEILEEPADKILLTDELEVNNLKYRAPTTPREEYERTGDGGGGVKNSILVMKQIDQSLEKKLRSKVK